MIFEADLQCVRGQSLHRDESFGVQEAEKGGYSFPLIARRSGHLYLRLQVPCYENWERNLPCGDCSNRI